MIRISKTWKGRFLRSLILLLPLLLALVGCREEPTPEPTPSPTPAPTATPTPLPPDAPVPARIRARGYLIVGLRYDMPPFGYVTEEGELAGFDVDMGRELARRWLGTPRAVRFQQVRSDTAVDHIRAGDVDLVISALLHTQGAEQQVDFAPPVFEDGQAILIHTRDALSITTPISLEGRMTGVVAGSEAADALAATVPFTPSTMVYADFDQALDGLARGEVVAVADLRRRLVRGLARLPDTAIVGQYSQAFLAPAYAPNEPGMANLTALTFQELFADGTFDALYQRWFPGDLPPAHEIWPGAVTTSLEAAARSTPSIDVIGAIQATGRLRVAVATDRPPFAYLTDADEPVGYEVQLVQLLAERWLGDRTAIDFLPVTPEEGLEMVTNGEAHLFIGAAAHTREAELQADFSLNTYIGGVGLMIQAGSPVDGIASLDGQMVAAVSGTDSADVLREAGEAARISLTILPKPTLAEGMAALEAGEVVAVVGERVDLLGPAYATPGLGVTADRLTRVPLGLVLPPGDSAFRDLVNLTLQEMNWDGTFPALYGEWFDDAPPRLPPWPGEPIYPLQLIAPQ